MSLSYNSVLSWVFAVMVCALSLSAGCYVGYRHETQHWTAADTALGEEHQLPYSKSATLELTEEALRGDGVLFERQPDNSIITLWRNADIGTRTNWFPLIIGVHPRYRYEINAVAEGSHKSKLIVNVRSEGIPDEQLATYKASNRFALFREIDELASKSPPSSSAPATGGVNFTLLPHEDLKALAARTTGKAQNWEIIAKDNGLSSPSDVVPFENVWVRNSLLKRATP